MGSIHNFGVKRLVLVGVFLFAASVAVYADTVPAIIDGLKGVVYIKQTHDSPWQVPVKGMQLLNGALIATGVKSHIDIAIGGTIIMIDSLSRYLLELPDSSDESAPVVLRLPETIPEIAKVSMQTLSPAAPIGFGDSVRIKTRTEDLRSGDTSETLLGPARSSGYVLDTPETPRRVDLEIRVEIIQP